MPRSSSCVSLLAVSRTPGEEGGRAKRAAEARSLLTLTAALVLLLEVVLVLTAVIGRLKENPTIVGLRERNISLLLQVASYTAQ